MDRQLDYSYSQEEEPLSRSATFARWISSEANALIKLATRIKLTADLHAQSLRVEEARQALHVLPEEENPKT